MCSTKTMASCGAPLLECMSGTTPTPGQLHFPDGSFWIMGDQSAAEEPDAGTLYPTTMEDSNGNQVVVSYASASEDTGYPIFGNTSSRIYRIADARSNVSYQFTYDTESIPHLTHIQSEISTPENYSFGFTSATLYSPFGGGQSFATADLLTTIVVTANNTPYAFSYTNANETVNSGELVSMTSPLGGTLSWAYRTFLYTGSGLSLREVQTRQMTPLYGARSIPGR